MSFPGANSGLSGIGQDITLVKSNTTRYSVSATFTTSGTFIAPSSGRYLIYLIGGGGNGGYGVYAAAGVTAGGGGGGASGQEITQIVTLYVGQSVSVTIGAAASSSTFGTLVTALGGGTGGNGASPNIQGTGGVAPAGAGAGGASGNAITGNRGAYPSILLPGEHLKLSYLAAGTTGFTNSGGGGGTTRLSVGGSSGGTGTDGYSAFNGAAGTNATPNSGGGGGGGGGGGNGYNGGTGGLGSVGYCVVLREVI